LFHVYSSYLKKILAKSCPPYILIILKKLLAKTLSSYYMVLLHNVKILQYNMFTTKGPNKHGGTKVMEASKVFFGMEFRSSKTVIEASRDFLKGKWK
jgi:hypothetical protein